MPVLLEHGRRYPRTLKVGEQPAMDVVIAVLPELARGTASGAVRR